MITMKISMVTIAWHIVDIEMILWINMSQQIGRKKKQKEQEWG